MSSKNKDERAHVNTLLKVLQEKVRRLYVIVDRDAGHQRHTSSGWDFQLSCDGRVAYCEAKEENGKLSTWQEFTRAQIKAAGSPYRVVRFWADGEFFTVDDGPRIAITDAVLEHFMEG
jgi:hypothetical protein